MPVFFIPTPSRNVKCRYKSFFSLFFLGGGKDWNYKQCRFFGRASSLLIDFLLEGAQFHGADSMIMLSISRRKGKEPLFLSLDEAFPRLKTFKKLLASWKTASLCLIVEVRGVRSSSGMLTGLTPGESIGFPGSVDFLGGRSPIQKLTTRDCGKQLT